MFPTEDKKETNRKFLVPPKIKSTYQNFKLIAETSSYKVFEAEDRNSKAKHAIRILDHSKNLVNNEFALTATFFVQELLHLQYRYPGSALTNTFEITDDGQHLACATLNYLPLSCQIDEKKEVLDPKASKLMEKLISDAMFDIEFLWKNLQMKKVIDILGPESLCFMQEKDAFFLSDWAKALETVTDDLSMSVSISQSKVGDKILTSQDLAGEIKGLAFAALKLNKVDIEVFHQMKDPELYNLAVKSVLEECFNDSMKLQEMLERMLSLDLQKLPRLEELWIKDLDRKELKEQIQILEKANKLLEDKIIEQDQILTRKTVEQQEEAKTEQERVKSLFQQSLQDPPQWKMTMKQTFSSKYKSPNMKLSNGDRSVTLQKYDGEFHIALGDKEMCRGVHKWKIFFKSNNHTGLGLVAGISEMNSEPTKFVFGLFTEIYQKYNINACTVWNQRWINSTNSLAKSFPDNNKWDNKWWHYILNFDEKVFTIVCPDGTTHNMPIKSNSIYRIYVEVGQMNNSFELVEE